MSAPAPTARFVQTPTSRKRYLMNYQLDLATGETITGITVAITSPTDGSNVGGARVTGLAVDPTGQSAAYFFDFASPTLANGQIYNVQFTTTTTVGQILNDLVEYIVRDQVGSGAP